MDLNWSYWDLVDAHPISCLSKEEFEGECNKEERKRESAASGRGWLEAGRDIVCLWLWATGKHGLPRLMCVFVCVFKGVFVNEGGECTQGQCLCPYIWTYI